MWKRNYSNKLKIVSILITVCFMFLIGAALSRGGVVAMNHDSYVAKTKTTKKLNDDKVQYKTVLGNVYDAKGAPILESSETIDKSKYEYNKSYSHLLGSVSLSNDAYLSNNWETLTDTSAPDAVDNKGYSVMLTINNDLQQFAYEQTEGTRASVVVLKRHSGELVAMTSTYQQDFDLGSDITDEEIAAYNNCGESVWVPEYLNSYPPGSCQKIFSSAVAYETGNGDYTIDDTGEISYGGDKICNFEKKAYGSGLDMEKAFSVSANTYFASLFNKTDVGDIRRLSDALKLNDSIETDFGKINNNFSFGGYSDFDVGLLAIGQKNELSSVGMAMMTQGVIDNEIYQPHVTKATCYSDKNGELKTKETTKENLLTSGILKDGTSEQVRQLMENTAHSDGYGLSDNILGAKTGTAEIEIDGTYTDRASMVAYDEDYIVVVSKIESSMGISNKDLVEKIFKKLDDVSQ